MSSSTYLSQLTVIETIILYLNLPRSSYWLTLRHFGQRNSCPEGRNRVAQIGRESAYGPRVRHF